MYASEQTAEVIKEIFDEHVRGLQEKRGYRICGGYNVITFQIPHENVPNVAYLIDFQSGERLLYVTDFEFVPYNLARWKINHFLIAVNRSEEVSEDDEAREHRIRGHSSLEVVKEFLRTSMSDRCRSVTACHLSSKYADEDKILTELQELCGDGVKVSIAHRGQTIEL